MNFDKEKYNRLVAMYLDGLTNDMIQKELDITKSEFDHYLMTLQFRERQLRSKHKTYYRLNDYCDKIAKEQGEGV